MTAGGRCGKGDDPARRGAPQRLTEKLCTSIDRQDTDPDTEHQAHDQPLLSPSLFPVSFLSPPPRSPSPSRPARRAVDHVPRPLPEHAKTPRRRLSPRRHDLFSAPSPLRSSCRAPWRIQSPHHGILPARLLQFPLLRGPIFSRLPASVFGLVRRRALSMSVVLEGARTQGARHPTKDLAERAPSAEPQDPC